MKKNNNNQFDQYFVKQHNQSWCGLACLSMVCKYYGGEFPQEKLVKLSGTHVSGTTLLGLYQAAQTLGLAAEGLEGDTEELAKLKHPAILHTIAESGLQHYVLYLGMDGEMFMIADPATGIVRLTAEALNQIWRSRALLAIKKTECFKKVKDVNREKYEWLKSLLKPDVTILSIILALSVVFSVLGICMALFSQKLVDDILPGKDLERLILGASILSVLLFIKNATGYYRGILSARQVRDFSNRIVNQFYNLILYLPKSFFDSLKAGEITARLNDASRIQRTVNYISGTFVIDLITIVVVTVFLFVYWWPAAVFTLIASGLFAFVFLRNAQNILSGQQKMMADYAQSESFFFNSVQGVDVIKSFGKEGVFSNSAKTVFAVFQNSIFDLALLNNKIGFQTQNIAVALVVTIMSICSYGVFEERITLGELVAILTFSNTVLGRITSLMGAYFTYQEAKVAYQRLYEFVGVEPEAGKENHSQAAPPKEITSLALRQVSFRYPGRPQVLRNLSFEALRGDITLIQGEIGCGKSTLLNILMRLYTPEQGEILVNEESVFHYSLEQWRKLISMMPQETKLFNATLLENICLDSTEENMQKVFVLCQHYGVDKYFKALPMSYLTRVGEDGINLSGGQRQLVGLCRALFQNPKILLLDEPTNNMDQESIHLFWDIIQKEKAHRVCVLVSHDETVVKKADKIFKIHIS